MNAITKIMWGGLLLLTLKNAHSQPPVREQQLEVTYNKTVSICFPAIIKSVDRGSRDVMAQKAKGVENILQLKAARENFPETNLTVITADGEIHEFAVRYATEPENLVLNTAEVSGVTESDFPALIFETAMTEPDFEKAASTIIKARRSVRLIVEKKHKVGIALFGIFIKDNTLFFHLRISNHSNINYEVEFLRFFIKDREKVKRTASQEISLEPVYTFGNIHYFEGNSSRDVVYALQKFTIPDAKRLVIEMYEKNGGRNLKLIIKNRSIVNARLVH